MILRGRGGLALDELEAKAFSGKLAKPLSFSWLHMMAQELQGTRENRVAMSDEICGNQSKIFAIN